MVTSALLLVLSVAPPRLVVAPLHAEQASEELTLFAGEHLAQALHERGFETLTGTDVMASLGPERAAQLFACVANPVGGCLGEFTSVLAVDAVVSGTLARKSGVVSVDVRVVNVLTGKSLASARSETTEERRTSAIIDTVADALALQLKGEVGAPSRGGPRLWVPVGVGVGLAGAGGALLAFSFSQVDDLTRAPRADEAPLPYVVARQQFRDAVMMRTTGITLLGLGAATAIAGVVLALTAPVAIIPEADAQHAGLTVSGVFP